MIEWFPHERAPLPRTRLRYVDLDSVLSDGKVERESKAPGFVLLFYGEETEVVFLLGGEPVTAARFGARSRGVVPLSSVRRRATTEREWADVAYFLAPEPQLRAMFASVAQKPELGAADLPITRPSALFATMRERGFSGVVEFAEPGKVHYMVFDDGMPVHGFFADQRRRGDVEAGATLSSRLETLFEPGRAQRLGARGYATVSRLPVQASPALAEVYSDLVAAAIRATGEATGHDVALQCFNDALERMRIRRDGFGHYRLKADGRLDGESCAGAEELTEAVTMLLMDALSAADRAGAPSPAVVLERVTHDNRFVLQANGFFDRLPWPITH